jgi:hypothetical protein
MPDAIPGAAGGGGRVRVRVGGGDAEARLPVAGAWPRALRPARPRLRRRRTLQHAHLRVWRLRCYRRPLPRASPPRPRALPPPRLAVRGSLATRTRHTLRFPIFIDAIAFANEPRKRKLQHFNETHERTKRANAIALCATRT